MQNDSNTVGSIIGPLVEGKFWMKLLGVLMIISGAIQALTIVGILWAWLPIWLGVLLFQASSHAEQAVAGNDATAGRAATDKLRLFFMIQGVLIMIMIVGMLLMVFMGLGTGIMAGLSR